MRLLLMYIYISFGALIRILSLLDIEGPSNRNNYF
jgi:hypothetical protein